MVAVGRVAETAGDAEVVVGGVAVVVGVKAAAREAGARVEVKGSVGAVEAMVREAKAAVAMAVATAVAMAVAMVVETEGAMEAATAA
jgi:hypothetical protein